MIDEIINRNLRNPIPDPYEYEDEESDRERWHDKRCTNCGSNYHQTKDCPDLACFTCGEKHFSNNCPYNMEK